jgi:hypothetical protein
LLWNGAGDFNVKLPEKRFRRQYTMGWYLWKQRRGEISNVDGYDDYVTGKLP